MPRPVLCSHYQLFRFSSDPSLRTGLRRVRTALRRPRRIAPRKRSYDGGDRRLVWRVSPRDRRLTAETYVGQVAKPRTMPEYSGKRRTRLKRGTAWWWTQFGRTGLQQRDSLPAGNYAGKVHRGDGAGTESLKPWRQ